MELNSRKICPYYTLAVAAMIAYVSHKIKETIP